MFQFYIFPTFRREHSMRYILNIINGHYLVPIWKCQEPHIVFCIKCRFFSASLISSFQDFSILHPNNEKSLLVSHYLLLIYVSCFVNDVACAQTFFPLTFLHNELLFILKYLTQALALLGSQGFFLTSLGSLSFSIPYNLFLHYDTFIILLLY